jgi:hypothetical protein
MFIFCCRDAARRGWERKGGRGAVDPVKQLLDEARRENLSHAGRPTDKRELPAAHPGSHVSANQRLNADRVDQRKPTKVNHHVPETQFDVPETHFDFREPFFAKVSDAPV